MVYRVKRFSQMTEEQRDFGFFRNLFVSTLHPKHIWRRAKKGLVGGVIGGLIAGPAGFALGAHLGAAKGHVDSYVEEAEKNGD